MDAVQFLKEVRRMCDAKADDCDGCPFEHSHERDVCRVFDAPDETVRIVEEWSKAHPVMTNAMKFEEVFGGIYVTRIEACADKEGNGCYILGEAWLNMPYKERGEE